MPPAQFTLQKYANVGTKEPFTAAFIGLSDLLDATVLDSAKQTEIRNIIMEIYMDCLLPGFLSLRKIHQPDAEGLKPLRKLLATTLDSCSSKTRRLKRVVRSSVRNIQSYPHSATG
jgi:hypothetical protein